MSPFNKLITCPSCGSQLDISGSATDTVTYRLPKPREIGHFDLLEHVGRGHFGDVWRARDNVLARIVAVKIPRTADLDQEAARMFLREAQAAAKLRHEHIVAVHEVGREGDAIFIVSDFIEGVSLAEYLREKRFAPREAAALCQKVAEALEHAHRHGIVHRDLKPANIMLDLENRPHVLDFGLAKQDAGEFTITVRGEILGTPAYMSPEQARGEAEKADGRSDVYSLGVVLFELISHRRPFLGDSRLLVQQILNDEPPAPRKLNREIDRDLETICLKAINKQPKDRYQTAREMADDLGRFLRGESIVGRRAGVVERGWKKVRANPAVSALAAGMLLLVGVVAALWFSSGEAAPTRRVVLETTPAGARLAIVPVDRNTGLLKTDGKILPRKKTPIEIDLPPGEYLVVADVPGHGFHEVYRYVPGATNEARQGTFPHANWTPLEDGGFKWPSIQIPRSSDAKAGMTLVPGGRFTMGSGEMQDTPEHQQSVNDLLVDPHEVTLSRFKAVMDFTPSEVKTMTPPLDPQAAVVYVRFDSARMFAELAGKRLMTEVEFEYLATGGGVSRFPWALGRPTPMDGESDGEWPTELVKQPAYDQTPTMPPIHGLYSNVAEWTDSTGLSYLHLWPEKFDAQSDPQGVRLMQLDEVLATTMRLSRVVRGAPVEVIAGGPATSEGLQRGPRQRTSIERTQHGRTIGFRCCRSAKPRFLDE